MVMLLLLWIPASFHAGAEDDFYCVFDEADILTDDEWWDLEDKAEQLSLDYGCGVYIVTAPCYDPDFDSAEQYAKTFYMDHVLGMGDGQDGMMLTLCMEERQYWLLAYGDYGNAVLTDFGREKMQDKFLGDFGDDDWYGGFEDYLDQAEFYLKQAEKGKPFDVDYKGPGHAVKAYGIAFAVGSVVALIVCFVFKFQMNTAMKQTSASAYVEKNGFEITTRQDRYTHTTTTRTRIKSNSGGGSGGGSSGGGTSTGSDGFSGSGGSF